MKGLSQMPRRIKLTKEELAYLYGPRTAKEIAHKYECTAGGIRKKLRDWGITKNMQNDVKDGFTLEEVKRLLHLNQGSLFSIRESEREGKRIVYAEKTVRTCYPYHVQATSGECYTYGEIYADRCRKEGIGFWRQETA